MWSLQYFLTKEVICVARHVQQFHSYIITCMLIRGDKPSQLRSVDCEPQLNSCPHTLTIEFGVGISTHFMCYSRGQNLVIITFYQWGIEISILDFEFWHFLMWTIICCRGEKCLIKFVLTDWSNLTVFVHCYMFHTFLLKNYTWGFTRTYVNILQLFINWLNKKNTAKRTVSSDNNMLSLKRKLCYARKI